MKLFSRRIKKTGCRGSIIIEIRISIWTAYSILKRTNYIKIELNIFTIIQETAKKTTKEKITHTFSKKRILIHRWGFP